MQNRQWSTNVTFLVSVSFSFLALVCVLYVISPHSVFGHLASVSKSCFIAHKLELSMIVVGLLLHLGSYFLTCTNYISW